MGLINRVHTTAKVRDMVNAYYDSLRQARRNVAWCFGFVPWEVLRAMDIPFWHLESYGAYVAARRGESDVMKRLAEAEGYGPDCCSYGRISHGNVLMIEADDPRLSPEFHVPKPDFLFGINGCSTQALICNSFSRQWGIPTYVIDIPMGYHDSEFERNVAYVRKQIERGLVTFLEEVTGRRLDYDRLREVVALVYKAAQLRVECLKLGKHIPAPMTIFDLFISLAPIHYLRGTYESVQYFEELLTELRDRVSNGIASVPNEKYRLYWDNLPIWFKLGALSEKLASYKAIPIVGLYTHGCFYAEPEILDPKDPFDFMARELCNHFTYFTLEVKINKLAKWVDEFSLDGLVMHSSRTCRPADIGQHDLIDAMLRRKGIPGVMIDGDPTDPNYFSEAQTNTRIEAFIEVLTMMKRGRG